MLAAVMVSTNILSSHLIAIQDSEIKIPSNFVKLVSFLSTNIRPDGSSFIFGLKDVNTFEELKAKLIGLKTELNDSKASFSSSFPKTYALMGGDHLGYNKFLHSLEYLCKHETPVSFLIALLGFISDVGTHLNRTDHMVSSGMLYTTVFTNNSSRILSHNNYMKVSESVMAYFGDGEFSVLHALICVLFIDSVTITVPGVKEPILKGVPTNAKFINF